ncbi:hypothetical protein C8Q75DRAFT_320591 [Abortiporus biennis]|nr:hypothetical protein C8Q75DRAFT_320591 [Abortiporus biennis]
MAHTTSGRYIPYKSFSPIFPVQRRSLWRWFLLSISFKLLFFSFPPFSCCSVLWFMFNERHDYMLIGSVEPIYIPVQNVVVNSFVVALYSTLFVADGVVDVMNSFRCRKGQSIIRKYVNLMQLVCHASATRVTLLCRLLSMHIWTALVPLLHCSSKNSKETKTVQKHSI